MDASGDAGPVNTDPVLLSRVGRGGLERVRACPLVFKAIAVSSVWPLVSTVMSE